MSNLENLGMGVLIGILDGNRHTVQAISSSLGKTVTALELKDNNLIFAFGDNTQLRVWDGGQSCCENRYMRTDDDLAYFIGGQLLDMELRDAPDEIDEHGEAHEVQFFAVKTSKGQFVMSNHNEHNGYYGGFYIEARVSPAQIH